MNRYIQRYQGKDDMPQATVEAIRAIPHLTVLDETLRMLLVEAPLEELQNCLRVLPDWLVTSERFYKVPDPRPKVDSKFQRKAIALQN